MRLSECLGTQVCSQVLFFLKSYDQTKISVLSADMD